MAFAFTIQINDPNHLQQDAAVVPTYEKAAFDWGVYIGGLGSIDIQINIAATASMRASGAPTRSRWATDGSRVCLSERYGCRTGEWSRSERRCFRPHDHDRPVLPSK